MSKTQQTTLAEEAGGVICGGLIKKSEYDKATKKDVWAYAMAYVMPDEWFDIYVAIKKAGDHELASKVADKYSWSVI